jgi:cytochrome b subunit of formate dehydrogenase
MFFLKKTIYYVLLPPFQIISCSGFSRYIVFCYVSRKAKKTYNLEWTEYITAMFKQRKQYVSFHFSLQAFYFQASLVQTRDETQ